MAAEWNADMICVAKFNQAMSIERKLAVVFLSLLLGCNVVSEPLETPESVEAATIAHYQALAAEDPTAEVQYLLLQYWFREEYEIALPRFVELAEAGHPMAALMVSSAYRHGLGTAPDAERADAWKERATLASDDEVTQAWLLSTD